MSMTRKSWLTPAHVLSTVAALAVLLFLLVPEQRTDNHPFSSYSPGPNGARGLYDILNRLGYAAQRRVRPFSDPLDSNAAYIILGTTRQLTTLERSNLLDAVRRGATIIFTADDGLGSFTDSLGFSLVPALGRFQTMRNTTVIGGNPDQPKESERSVARSTATMFFPITASLVSKRRMSETKRFMWIAERSADSADPGVVSDTAGNSPATALILGHHFGHGYAVAVMPPELLTNQLLRTGRPPIAVVRALEYGGRHLVIFDEYHHGFGPHTDVVGAIETALADTTPGRMLLQVIIAALILLMAVAVRPLPPLPSMPIQRRSPLEHVGALANAYQRVGHRLDTCQFAADRLVRGLRRRHSLGIAYSLPHSIYIAALRNRLPETDDEVRIVESALTQTSPEHVAVTGAAIAHIEKAFNADRS